jgi:CheY-like chemotaxis protein
MGTLNVLLAGGSAAGVKAVRALFSGARLELTTAADGLDCVMKLRQIEPDVLVLEATLLWGGWDGVLARMREESDLPTPPVLLLPGSRSG